MKVLDHRAGWGKVMRISIFGSGYVGLVQAAVFADVGHRVICMDIDEARVQRLRAGEVPFFEPGLSNMVLQAVEVQAVEVLVVETQAALN